MPVDHPLWSIRAIVDKALGARSRRPLRSGIRTRWEGEPESLDFGTYLVVERTLMFAL